MRLTMLILFVVTLATSNTLAKAHTAGNFNFFGDNGGSSDDVKECVRIAAKRLVTRGLTAKQYGASHHPDKQDPSFAYTVRYCKKYVSPSYDFGCLKGLRSNDYGGTEIGGSKSFGREDAQPAMPEGAIRSCAR